MCLVPDGGNVCPAVSLSWSGLCGMKTKGGLQFCGYLFSPGSEIFVLKEISKNTAPHLPWYAAYVILHEKLQIAFIMTYNAWVMPDCDILIQ